MELYERQQTEKCGGGLQDVKSTENTYAGLVGDNKEYLGLLVLTRDITDRQHIGTAFRLVHTCW
jgi:hypothetical protein